MLIATILSPGYQSFFVSPSTDIGQGPAQAGAVSRAGFRGIVRCRPKGENREPAHGRLPDERCRLLHLQVGLENSGVLNIRITLPKIVGHLEMFRGALVVPGLVQRQRQIVMGFG